MRPKPDSCRGCPAYHTGVGFVPPQGEPHLAEFLFVGQGPGEQEAEFGQPFYDRAPAGWKLRSWLRQVVPPLSERRCMFTNIVWCWLPEGRRGGAEGQPYGNRAPTPEEVSFCTSRHLRPLLATLPEVRHVLTVGKPAAAWFLDEERSKQRYLGTTHRIELPTSASKETHE